MSVEAMRQCWADDFPVLCDGVTPAVVTAVALAIADVVNDDHGFEFYGSIARLAHKARVGRKVAGRVVGHLVDVGVLTLVEQRRGRTARYRWNVEQVATRVESTQVVDSTRVESTQVPASTRRGTRVESTRDTKGDQGQLQAFGATTDVVAARGLDRRTSTAVYQAVARDVTTRYYDWVKDTTGRAPLTPFPAIMKIVERAVAAGWDVSDVIKALAAMYRTGTALTTQTLERHLDGRAKIARNPNTAAARTGSYLRERLAHAAAEQHVTEVTTND